jgi:hypothetical protein
LISTENPHASRQTECRRGHTHPKAPSRWGKRKILRTRKVEMPLTGYAPSKTARRAKRNLCPSNHLVKMHQSATCCDEICSNLRSAPTPNKRRAHRTVLVWQEGRGRVHKGIDKNPDRVQNPAHSRARLRGCCESTKPSQFSKPWKTRSSGSRLAAKAADSSHRSVAKGATFCLMQHLNRF